MRNERGKRKGVYKVLRGVKKLDERGIYEREK